MPAHIASGNAIRARLRSPVERVLTAQQCRLGLLLGTVGMVRTRGRIALANPVYNFRRLAWLNFG